MAKIKAGNVAILVIALLVIGAGAVYAIAKINPDLILGPVPTLEIDYDAIEPAETPNTDEGVASEPSDEATELVSEEAEQPSSVEAERPALSSDTERALSERSLGDATAPITMREFASLTCGHCGHFHKEVFDKIKSEYIDTGKVYVIFTDFPLNKPALDATMIARCLPEERYFSFTEYLFKNQDKWAYSEDYLTFLKQNAALAGMGSEAFDACLNNEELRQGIANNMREAQKKYGINSTPSFVVNEGETFSGAKDFAAFKKMFDEKLAE